MLPRRRFGGDASLAFAALLSMLCVSAAHAAGDKVAVTEIGFGDSHVAGACDAGGPAKRRGRCAATPSAPPRLERPLFAVVSISDQTVSIYNHEGLVTRSEVSTGMEGHATPKGIYSIIGRERMHASNIYSGAPMPFMQRLTWSGIAMHLGVVPGHPASHGCVRLPADFAAKLWGMTRIGERVVIAPHDVMPTSFEHALLPTPKMQIFADAGAAADSAAAPQSAAVSSAEPPKLNPHQFAERLKAKAALDRKAAAKADAEAFLAVDAKETDAIRLAEELRAAETADSAALAKADALAKDFEAATGAAKDAAAAAKSKAEEERVTAATKLDAAKKASEANARELADAYKRWTGAAKAFEDARTAERDAEFRTAPVSVLISKADKRVYVRQGLAPIFDAPANVRDPKTPLGSHLYIASSTDLDGGSLKWSVISIPPLRVDQPGEKKRAKSAEPDSDFFSSYPALSASPEEALERVEISQEVRDRIAERLWTGASIIISDQPLSGETNNVGTDLVVRLR
ncbi:L,D-transpeptidase family protein [Methylocystis parvus]|uniref:L,D-transpeptidase family protein n=1 Tax=Methylocystis parvus TaxID=134 RepID=A0A6B8M3S2_9HYPH|nr:L,D-transpeptidase family protein [Methylocystis parvus]QGM96073.1 L,D-transpeptidase family protein [Methylocystis parvus]WBK00109.1 L,D-transpeptidase family protein [Methylocystis parvus OBBP]